MTPTSQTIRTITPELCGLNASYVGLARRRAVGRTEPRQAAGGFNS